MSPVDKHQQSFLFPMFQLSGRMLAVYTISLPSLSLAACILISLIFNFEKITRTECRVYNFLPSISAAVGDLTPQRYIWRIGIALHCAPRLLMALAYYNYYQSYKVITWKGLYNILTCLNSLLHIAENLCLVTLTFVSSTENFLIHESSFGGFVAFSECYMVLTLVLFHWSHSSCGSDSMDKSSFRWKLILAISNIVFLFAALYVYWRHNTYCEPGMYSIFGLLEYLVVATNIAFHGTFFMDFRETSLNLNACSSYHTQKKKER